MKKLISIIGFALLLSGCASANKKVFMAEFAAASTADAGMKGYAAFYNVAIQNPTNYHTTATQLNSDRATASALSVKIASSIATTEALRVSAATNSAAKPSLAAALQILSENSSNLLSTVNTLIH
jgi:hypothetical protein